MMRTTSLAAAAALLFVVAPHKDLSAQQLHTIIVESPTMRTGEMMPRQYTPDGRNDSPPITWRNLPSGTRQIAVIIEDHGAGNPPPWVHWIIYNIPGTATGLPEGIPIDPAAPMPPGLEGATQGNNGWGRAIYRGPAPPAGRTNEYNTVVYALDAELNLPPALTRAELLAAMEGHIIGRGEMVPVAARQPMPAP
jgi:Raf kinase inhibitor-like YbhB/YbcL family protein